MVNLIIKFFTQFNFRMATYVCCSVFANAFLLIYDIVCAVDNPESSEWYKSQISLHFLFMFARILLLVIHKKNMAELKSKKTVDDRTSKSVCISTSIFMYMLGVEILRSSILVFYSRVPVRAPLSFLVIHGNYIMIRLIASLVGKMHYQEPSKLSSFLRCKKYLSRTECLFLMVVLIHRVITVYGINNNVLSFINFISGLCVGIYTFILGSILVYIGVKLS